MRQIKKDSTNVSVEIYIIDDTDGTPETGVVFNTAGIDLNYRRDGAVVVSITEIDLTTPALTDAHEDGGFLHVSNGRYRLDVPDAAFATGVSQVTIGGTVTGMVVLPVTIQLVDFDPDDAVRMGLTALPNAAADAGGGLPISDAGGLDLDSVLSGNTPQTGDNFARLGAPAGASLSADIADVPTISEFNARTLVAASYFDSAVDTVANVTTVATLTGHTAQTGDSFARLGAPAGVDTAADIAALKAETVLIVADTSELQTDDLPGLIAALNDVSTADLDTAVNKGFVTTTMAESYAADGAIGTPAQLLYEIVQNMTEFAISGTTWTTKKRDGVTTAATYTLDDDTTPTSKTRAT